MNSVRLGPARAIYNVLVRGDPASSSVKATVRWTYVAAKRGTIECSTSHAWEEAFEAEVKAHAEGGRPPRMSLAPPHVAPPSAPPSQSARDTGAHSPGVAAPTVPPAPGAGSDEPSAANTRPNNLLLSFEGFRRAMGDMQRKGMILGYREVALERLEVDLTATAVGEPTLEYQLTRLFLAYGETMMEDTQPALVVRANRQQVGLYTRSGFRWDSASGRR